MTELVFFSDQSMPLFFTVLHFHANSLRLNIFTSAKSSGRYVASCLVIAPKLPKENVEKSGMGFKAINGYHGRSIN